MPVYDINPLHDALKLPQVLVDACLYCKVKPDCNEQSQGCLFRQLVPFQEQPSRADSQRAYRERLAAAQKTKEYWQKKYGRK